MGLIFLLLSVIVGLFVFGIYYGIKKLVKKTRKGNVIDIRIKAYTNPSEPEKPKSKPKMQIIKEFPKNYNLN